MLCPLKDPRRGWGAVIAGLGRAAGSRVGAVVVVGRGDVRLLLARVGWGHAGCDGACGSCPALALL